MSPKTLIPKGPASVPHNAVPHSCCARMPAHGIMLFEESNNKKPNVSTLHSSKHPKSLHLPASALLHQHQSHPVGPPLPAAALVLAAVAVAAAGRGVLLSAGPMPCV